MLLSMTGYGESHSHDRDLSVSAEVRSVNNRFLKVTVRVPEEFQLLEPEVERLARGKVKRGTVSVRLRIRREPRAEDFRLSTVALRSYVEQLRGFARDAGIEPVIDLTRIAQLPGVMRDPIERDDGPMTLWERIEPVIAAAFEQSQTMRVSEGAAMERELRGLTLAMRSHMKEIRSRAPEVVSSYRDRLTERLKTTLAAVNVALDPVAIVREVALFAERADIAEEITRLESHLEQFDATLGEPDSPGRKLDFLVQELFREANTIGSKANDVLISRQAVEIKGFTEKVRELIQNVE